MGDEKIALEKDHPTEGETIMARCNGYLISGCQFLRCTLNPWVEDNRALPKLWS